jgi:hypothetical protein
LKLRLVRQSGWLTDFEYEEELKRAIQHRNCELREAAYNLGEEDEYDFSEEEEEGQAIFRQT